MSELNKSKKRSKTALKDESEEIVVQKKQKKNKFNNKNAKKRKETEEENENENENHEIVEPTREQLLESLKPENVINVQTVRQKKKKKHQKNVEVHKTNTTEKERENNEVYLKNWENQVNWKFEKKRQISIQKNIFDELEIDEDYWLIAIQYLAKSKGIAREAIIKEAENIIEKIDDKIDSTNRNEMIQNISYKRARTMLQTLQ